MTITRHIVATKVVGSAHLVDSGATFTIYTVEDTPVLVATATEAPASSGQYVATYTSRAKWGKWRRNGTIVANWEAFRLSDPLYGEKHDLTSPTDGQEVTLDTVYASADDYTVTYDARDADGVAIAIGYTKAADKITLNTWGNTISTLVLVLTEKRPT